MIETISAASMPSRRAITKEAPIGRNPTEGVGFASIVRHRIISGRGRHGALRAVAPRRYDGAVAPPPTSDPPRRLLILDGHSLAYRAFFALPSTLATTTGQVTNAVYGFTSMLIKLLTEERPDLIAVAFDVGKPV